MRLYDKRFRVNDPSIKYPCDHPRDGVLFKGHQPIFCEYTCRLDLAPFKFKQIYKRNIEKKTTAEYIKKIDLVREYFKNADKKTITVDDFITASGCKNHHFIHRNTMLDIELVFPMAVSTAQHTHDWMWSMAPVTFGLDAVWHANAIVYALVNDHDGVCKLNVTSRYVGYHEKPHINVRLLGRKNIKIFNSFSLK